MTNVHLLDILMHIIIIIVRPLHYIIIFTVALRYYFATLDIFKISNDLTVSGTTMRTNFKLLVCNILKFTMFIPSLLFSPGAIVHDM